MDDEVLVEAVARIIYAAGLIDPPKEAIDEEWPYWKDEARAAIRVVREAVIEECARFVEDTPIYSSGEVCGIEKAVAKRIRALKETK